MCFYAILSNAELSVTGVLRYQTKLLEAGIPMLPAALASMPMPSYAHCS
jgi:hypothetical protein